MKSKPVMMAVRLVASIPWVTSSAVEADPNPLFPAMPVIEDNMLNMLSILINSFYTTANLKRNCVLFDWLSVISLTYVWFSSSGYPTEEYFRIYIQLKK